MLRLLFSISVLLCLLKANSQSTELTIYVKDISELKGHLKIGLFNNENNFRLKVNPIDSVLLEVKSHKLSYTFKQLALGVYAVAVYHDENNDGILNKRQLGVPIEGVGFSNFETKKRKPPEFKEASFHLQDNLSIEISLFYTKN